MIKNVIFDLDGTLLDTIGDIKNALNEALISFNLPPITYEEAVSFIGNGTAKLIQRALKGVVLSQIDYQNFHKLYMRRQLELQLANTKPFLGIDELLDRLIKLGVRLFVYSNKPDDFAVTLISDRFPNIFTEIIGQKEGRPPKPDVTEFLIMMQRHHIDPSESLYVGDSIVDIKTARNANMPCAAVSWGYVDRVKLIEGKPDFIVDNTEQLYNIIIAYPNPHV